MLRVRVQIYAALILVTGNVYALAQSPRTDVVPVTADNFNRAESDLYIGKIVKDGAFGKFLHRREPAAIDNQTVIRLNRDTLYSSAVFDLDAGPVVITLPNPGKRFMSMQVITEDHYVFEVDYGAGRYNFTKAEVGTRYVTMALRTFVDPSSPQDLKLAHALQDAVTVQQRNAGRFEVPNWDPVSQKKMRDALLILSASLPDLKKAFGSRVQVDQVRHLIGTAAAWGGNPERDAIYLNITPNKNDGATVYKLSVPGKVPVNAFWSVTVYDAQGYLKKNQYDAYSLNNITAKKGADGSVPIQFGGCDGKIQNCLPTMSGWNYMVRLYRPRDDILNGKWKFPEAQPVNYLPTNLALDASRGIAVRRHAAYNGVMKRESDSPASTYVARIIIAAVATLAAITLPCFQPSFAAPMRCSGEETSLHYRMQEKYGSGVGSGLHHKLRSSSVHLQEDWLLG